MTFTTSISVKDLIDWLNPKFLYHTVWQINANALKNDPELQNEVKEKHAQMVNISMKILSPISVYGFYKFSALNGTICPPHECEINRDDTVAFQLVTLGPEAVEKARQLKENGEYLDYFYWHGFCAALAEAFAARLHAMIRVEMGLEKEEEQSPEKEFRHEYPGKRLSFGYEALPDIMEQKNVLKLLNAEKIGIVSTESGMLEPEFSTCAMILKCNTSFASFARRGRGDVTL